MDILRFTTAGSIDDGKSTLIGRLLFETGNIKNDVLQSLSSSSESEEEMSFNLAHITDGLRSERQQGITIDVAYKYFTTKNRKYIITDAPGHFQYTKNLVSGASIVDVMIILIDAQNGITEQTRRHSLVASFLQISQIAIAINKMDTVAYDERVFSSIKKEYLAIADKLALKKVSFFPVSALSGENVTSPSMLMKWYKGKTLMQYLEKFKPAALNIITTRMSVQCVITSTEKGLEKGYAGKLLSGPLRVGEVIQIYPGVKFATIKTIIIGNINSIEATAGDNICIYFEKNIDAERGHLICNSPLFVSPKFQDRFEVTLCWLNSDVPLLFNQNYFLRINAFETTCQIINITHKIDVGSFEKYNNEESPKVNEFIRVIIKTKDKVMYDPHHVLRETGRGVIIDINTNYTSAAFIIEN